MPALTLSSLYYSSIASSLTPPPQTSPLLTCQLDTVADVSPLAMGNCQAAAEAAVVIEHPPLGKKVERIYFPVTARHVMSSNPAHFVALVVATSSTATSAANGSSSSTAATSAANGGASVKHLKLLRPDDVLMTGQVYRLVCVQDVLKEFATKKCVKLAKLLEGGGFVIDKNKHTIRSNTDLKSESCSSTKEEQPSAHRRGNSSASSSSRAMGKNQSSGGQWKPALQSISEIGA